MPSIPRWHSHSGPQFCRFSAYTLGMRTRFDRNVVIDTGGGGVLGGQPAFVFFDLIVVEYNSVVWSPCYKHDIESIERVQRRFSKRLPGLKNLPYEGRLV